MNAEEKDKFDLTLREGYAHLIKTRPSMPMKEFIHFLWSKLPDNLKMQNEELNKFCEVYDEIAKTTLDNAPLN